MSISQNLPRTFSRLSQTWGTKTGSRSSQTMKFGNGDLREPILQVADLMNTKFNEHSQGMLAELAKLPAAKVNDSGIWVYTMRPSDYLPKSTAESERLYAFVRTLINRWFADSSVKQYLENNIHISVCFFIWYFTTPHYFYATKEIRHTTRKGVQRQWNTILLAKEPKQQAKPTLSLATQEPKVRKTTNTQLPKQRQDQDRLRREIAELIHSEYPDCHLEWSDPTRIHLRISECTTNFNSDYYITGKKQKKIHKLYQDYTAVTNKVNKALERERLITESNHKLAKPTITIPNTTQAWDANLGTPPSPPELKRAPFNDGAAEAFNLDDDGSSPPDNWDDAF